MGKTLSLSGHDPLPAIVETIRDCIKAGLIPEVTVTDFNQTVRDLAENQPELEDYLQDLWDRV